MVDPPSIDAETAPLTTDLEVGQAVPSLRMALVFTARRSPLAAVSLEEGESTVVGRSPPADVVLSHASLSRQHARFELRDGRLTVTDLGSRNGTLVDEQRVQERVLAAGEQVQLGHITVSIAASGPGRRALALRHDKFFKRLDDEVVRARHFSRPLSLLLLRAPGMNAATLVPALQHALRKVDQIGWYSDDTLEVLLPETTSEEAAAWVASFSQQHPALAVSLGSFPQAGATAEELLDVIRSAVPLGEGAVARASRGAGTPPPPSTEGPVAQSASMRGALGDARKLAPTSLPVLVVGETGAGKELIAEILHGERKGSMVCVNCGALPLSLLQSTLFGHEKGAFTGADARRAGVFEAAQDGTVFLDEVGELPVEAQAALLRVLEKHEVTRVGGTTPVPVSTRVLTATWRNLEEMVAEGTFRQDLLYRLNAATVQVPPLRARPEDIGPLAQRFLEGGALELQRDVPQLTEEALLLLQRWRWPGNVRELKNVMLRAVVICEGGEIRAADLPPALQRAAPAEASTAGAFGRVATLPHKTLAEIEIEHIRTVLADCEGNRSEAARRLGISRNRLARKLANEDQV